MKHLSSKLIFIFIFLSAVSLIVLAFETGITGRTLKTTTNGCSCHGQSATTDVTVTIAGADTINTGQTLQYSLTVSKPSKTGAGLDIAVRRGTLTPVSTNIHLSNGELTHNLNIPMVNGSVTVQFNYTAPGTPATDTIWATGLATNSNGSTSGDDWNWAPSKRIIVRNPIGITNESISEEFKLNQNYPNPFNPVTNISFELIKKSYVRLVVMDLLGNEIAVLSDGVINEGNHNIVWNASDYASGVYFYKLILNGFTDTKRMVLLK